MAVRNHPVGSAPLHVLGPFLDFIRTVQTAEGQARPDIFLGKTLHFLKCLCFLCETDRWTCQDSDAFLHRMERPVYEDRDLKIPYEEQIRAQQSQKSRYFPLSS